jgi:HIRAN domain
MRDYDNLVDRNAVLVTWESREIGYLPRAVAQVLALDMDAGEQFNTIVNSIVREPQTRISATINRRE